MHNLYAGSFCGHGGPRPAGRRGRQVLAKDERHVLPWLRSGAKQPRRCSIDTLSERLCKPVDSVFSEANLSFLMIQAAYRLTAQTHSSNPDRFCPFEVVSCGRERKRGDSNPQQLFNCYVFSRHAPRPGRTASLRLSLQSWLMEEGRGLEPRC